MHRPIWTGSIGFGLVNVPVKLFSAQTSKEVHFHMLHDADGARIQQKRVCSADGEEVPWNHVVKGYEIAKGRYVEITPEELEALDPKASRTIEIEDFVDLAEIDPVYYQSTYYLAPDRGAQKPYGLLHAVMDRSQKVAIARMVMRTKQYLCAVRPLGKALAVSTMSYFDEIVPISEYEGMPRGEAKPAARELELAQRLVDSLATSFDPKKYADDHRERVLQLIKRKAKGETIEAPPPARRDKTVDLMSALEASLSRDGPPAKRPRAATPRRAAAEARGRAPRARKAARKTRRTRHAHHS